MIDTLITIANLLDKHKLYSIANRVDRAAIQILNVQRKYNQWMKVASDEDFQSLMDSEATDIFLKITMELGASKEVKEAGIWGDIGTAVMNNVAVPYQANQALKGQNEQVEYQQFYNYVNEFLTVTLPQFAAQIQQLEQQANQNVPKNPVEPNPPGYDDPGNDAEGKSLNVIKTAQSVDANIGSITEGIRTAIGDFRTKVEQVYQATGGIAGDKTHPNNPFAGHLLQAIDQNQSGFNIDDIEAVKASLFSFHDEVVQAHDDAASEYRAAIQEWEKQRNQWQNPRNIWEGLATNNFTPMSPPSNYTGRRNKRKPRGPAMERAKIKRLIEESRDNKKMMERLVEAFGLKNTLELEQYGHSL